MPTPSTYSRARPSSPSVTMSSAQVRARSCPRLSAHCTGSGTPETASSGCSTSTRRIPASPPGSAGSESPAAERELAPACETAREEHDNDRHERGDGHHPRPVGRVQPAHVAVLGVTEERVETAHQQRPDDRAPQAADAADDEQRQAEEREVEEDVLDVDRPLEVHEQPPGEARQCTGEDECPEPLAVDVDARGLRRERI